jgi:hypothetical protein
MTLINEIRTETANLCRGHAKELSETERKCWALVTAKGEEGVAIPVPEDLQYRNSFAHARLETGQYSGTGKGNRLALLSSRKDLRMQFAYLCQLLIDSDPVQVQGNPDLWWKNLAELIGNSIQSDRFYPIVAEIQVLKCLIELAPEHKWKWEGPSGNRHDIEGLLQSVEVKSTVSTSKRSIMINGTRQLEPKSGKPLHLALVRIEEVPGTGVSMEDLILEIEALPVVDASFMSTIENELFKLGFGQGHPVRKVGFGFLEQRIYAVDDHFPKLTSESFVGGQVPPGIGRINYEALLDNLESEVLDNWAAALPTPPNI